MTTPLPCQRALFDIPDDIAYFNTAFMSPLLKAAASAGRQAMEMKMHPWLCSSDDFFTQVGRPRRLFASVINADADDIAIIPAASYGIAVAARNLPVAKGQVILVLRDQFPSNVYSWQRLAEETGATIETVEPPTDGDWSAAMLARIEELGDRLAITACQHCHWTDGALIDLRAVSDATHAAGAALVVDLTQSIAAIPFDVEEIKPDFMVAAGYKWMLGPYGYGFMYVAPKWQEGVPLEENWINRAGSEDFSQLVNYQHDYQPGARRYDMGERAQFQLAPVVVAALEQLLDWEVPRIAASLKQMTDRIADHAQALGLGVRPAHLRSPHMIGLTFPDGLPRDLPARLAESEIHVSARGNAMRISPHLHISEMDMARLLDGLKKSL
ncbi:MAG: aminotransferase class V-fold PLP-dependent enzyme [Alphaproteobacteria bacterium]